MARRRSRGGPGSRLDSSFGAVLVLTLFIVVLSISRMGSIDQKANVVGKSDLPAVGVIDATQSNFRADQLQHVIATDQAEMLRRERGLDKSLATITEQFKAYEPFVADAHDRALWQGSRFQVA